VAEHGLTREPGEEPLFFMKEKVFHPQKKIEFAKQIQQGKSGVDKGEKPKVS